jgi:hypothetical protein
VIALALEFAWLICALHERSPEKSRVT